MRDLFRGICEATFELHNRDYISVQAIEDLMNDQDVFLSTGPHENEPRLGVIQHMQTILNGQIRQEEPLTSIEIGKHGDATTEPMCSQPQAHTGCVCASTAQLPLRATNAGTAQHTITDEQKVMIEANRHKALARRNSQQTSEADDASQVQREGREKSQPSQQDEARMESEGDFTCGGEVEDERPDHNLEHQTPDEPEQEQHEDFDDGDHTEQGEKPKKGKEPPKDPRATKASAYLEFMMMRSIVAGSIRTFRDLHHATPDQVPAPHCQCVHCKDEIHDKEHMFWKCPASAVIRKEYTDQMDQILAKAEREDRWRYDKLTDLMTKPCWRLCGIAPWDTIADHLVEELPRK